MRRLSLTFLIILPFLASGCAMIDRLRDPDDDTDSMADFDSPRVAETDRLREDADFRRENQIRQALRSRELVLGMHMEDVRSIWGEPRDVQTAGDSSMGNQRWVYFEGLSSRWGTSSARIIYFESGQVVGWETVHP
jgi:hypothetical protein